MRELAAVTSYKNENGNPYQTMDAIKNAGYTATFLQWYDELDWEYPQEKQLEYARKIGLNVIFCHLGYQNINDIWEDNEKGEQLVVRYKRNIKECSDNNVPIVIMHLTSKHEAPKANEIGIRRLQEIADYAKEKNVKIAFENTKIKGYLEYVFEHIKNSNIGLCYDAGHCHAHFNDEFNYKLFKNRIFAVHLHDNHGNDKDEHLLPQDGTIDWEHVIGKLKECNYDGPITLEVIYRNQYVNKCSVEEFFKESYKRATFIQDLFNEENN